MAHPPGVTTLNIVLNYPELLLLPAAASGLPDYVTRAPAYQDFLGVIRSQGDQWATEEPIPDSEVKRLQLSPQTLQALPALLAQVLTAVMQDATWQDLLWTVQNGVAPKEEAAAASTLGWTLDSVEPRYGLSYPEITYARSAEESTFSLRIRNDSARHLGVYVGFLSRGEPVVPESWTSRLPPGAPGGYESATVKYLGLLAPNASVAGLPGLTDPQLIQFALPSNADAAEVQFGGIGNGNWDSLVDAAGAIQTFVLDYAVPAVILANKQPASSSLGAWFQAALADQQLQAQILQAGEFILTDSTITDLSSLLAVLGEKMPAIMLGDALSCLRQELAAQLGSAAVGAAAPYLGWPAQSLKALLDTQAAASSALAAASSRLLAMPATFTLALAPGAVLDLALTIQPDPTTGKWPPAADSYTAIVTYAGGFWQQRTGALPADDQAVELTFGSVKNSGALAAAVTIDDAQAVRAAGKVTIDPASGPRRTPGKGRRPHDGSCRRHPARHPVSAPQHPDLCRRTVPLGSLQPTAAGRRERPWRRQFKHTRAHRPGRHYLAGIHPQPWLYLAGSGPRPARLRWGWAHQRRLHLPKHRHRRRQLLVGNAGLHICAAACTGVSTNESGRQFYLDPRDSGRYLREVTLDKSRFNLAAGKSYGRFHAADLADVAIHPAGYAVGISREFSRLEILQLPAEAVADCQAPWSRLLAGKGVRPGLLQQPVGVAVAPMVACSCLNMVMRVCRHSISMATPSRASAIPLFST